MCRVPNVFSSAAQPYNCGYNTQSRNVHGYQVSTQRVQRTRIAAQSNGCSTCPSTNLVAVLPLTAVQPRDNDLHSRPQGTNSRAYLIATVAAPSLRLARASATLGLVDSIGLNRSWRRGFPTLNTMRIQTEKWIMCQQHDVKAIFALVGYITLYIVFESYLWIDTDRCTMDPGDSWCLK